MMNKVSVSDIEGVGANLTDEIAALKTLAFRLLDEVGELQSQLDGAKGYIKRMGFEEAHKDAEALERVRALPEHFREQVVLSPDSVKVIRWCAETLEAAIKGEK